MTTDEKLHGIASDTSTVPASFFNVTVVPAETVDVLYMIKHCSDEESNPSAMALPPAAITVPPMTLQTPQFSLP